MWALCMFIHEMRLESIASVYIAEHSLPPFLLGLEASWQKLPVFLSLTSLSLSPSFSLFLHYLLSSHSSWIVSQLVG